MAVLTVQKVPQTGLKPTFQAADAAGDQVPVGSNRFLYVKNGGASEITVTLKSQKPCDQGTVHDIPVTVPAGEDRLIGFERDPDRFANSNGRAKFSYSNVTSVTVAALEV